MSLFRITTFVVLYNGTGNFENFLADEKPATLLQQNEILNLQKASGKCFSHFYSGTLVQPLNTHEGAVSHSFLGGIIKSDSLQCSVRVTTGWLLDKNDKRCKFCLTSVEAYNTPRPFYHTLQIYHRLICRHAQ